LYGSGGTMNEILQVLLNIISIGIICLAIIGIVVYFVLRVESEESEITMDSLIKFDERAKKSMNVKELEVMRNDIKILIEDTDFKFTYEKLARKIVAFCEGKINAIKQMEAKQNESRSMPKDSS
jgi:hypothetical protein